MPTKYIEVEHGNRMFAFNPAQVQYLRKENDNQTTIYIQGQPILVHTPYEALLRDIENPA